MAASGNSKEAKNESSDSDDSSSSSSSSNDDGKLAPMSSAQVKRKLQLAKVALDSFVIATEGMLRTAIAVTSCKKHTSMSCPFFVTCRSSVLHGTHALKKGCFQPPVHRHDDLEKTCNKYKRVIEWLKQIYVERINI